MAEKPKPEPDDKEQSQRFIDTARQLEADESGTSFENTFNKIAPIKPELVRKSKKA